MLAEIAPTVDGKPDVSKLSEINLQSIAERYRLQKIVFETARDVFDQIRPSWRGNKEYLLAQVFRIVQSFISSDKVLFFPPMQDSDDSKTRILMALNMQKIVRHVFDAIRFENTENIVPVFDTQFPIRSTGDMHTWWTSRRCEPTRKSHINLCVFDSAWEASEAFELDRNDKVEAWVKNDHLGFEVQYIYDGVVRKYRPDFIIRLANGRHLVLEVKGRDTQQDQIKREYLDEWVQAVNADGRFGHWAWAISKNPSDLPGIIFRLGVR
jgi:type III restriction enzyme